MVVLWCGFIQQGQFGRRPPFFVTELGPASLAEPGKPSLHLLNSEQPPLEFLALRMHPHQHHLFP